MALAAYCNQIKKRLPVNVAICQMMRLCSWLTETRPTQSVIAFQNSVPLALPPVGFEILFV